MVEGGRRIHAVHVGTTGGVTWGINRSPPRQGRVGRCIDPSDVCLSCSFMLD